MTVSFQFLLGLECDHSFQLFFVSLFITWISPRHFLSIHLQNFAQLFSNLYKWQMKSSCVWWFCSFWDIGSILSKWCFQFYVVLYQPHFSLYFHAHQLQFLTLYDKKVFYLFHWHNLHKFLFLFDPYKIL